jgi:hypothetical protein
VSENRVLRSMFGPKRDEVRGQWKKLQKGELHNLYSSPDIIRQIKENEVGGNVACMGEGRNMYRILMGKPDGIKIDLGRLAGGGGGVDWIHLAQDMDWWWAVLNVVMNLWVLMPGS